MSSQWNITENLVITPENGENPYVCDAHTDGGGWIVLQVTIEHTDASNLHILNEILFEKF